MQKANIQQKIKNLLPKRYFILGAPRSATSLVTGALENLGIPMSARYDNSYKRNRECPELVKINKKVLGFDKSFGDDRWFDPPTTEEIEKAFDVEAARHYIDSREGFLWGVKDPRMSLMMDYYLPLVEEDDVYLICIFRKPKFVAKSLSRNKKGGKQLFKKMVDRYNHDIINSVKKFVGISD